MLTRGTQMRAIIGTVDLDEPLRSAAHRTDLIAACGAVTTRLSLAANGTSHISPSHTLYNSSENQRVSAEYALHPRDIRGATAPGRREDA
jgi:hypothetical protein